MFDSDFIAGIFRDSQLSSSGSKLAFIAGLSVMVEQEDANNPIVKSIANLATNNFIINTCISGC